MTIRCDGGRPAFAAPPLRRRPLDAGELDAAVGALGVAPEKVVDGQWLNNGPDWLGIVVDSAETVLALAPDAAAMKPFDKVGVIGATSAGSECAFEVRAFLGGPAPFEDPVTGSLNAGFAQWLTSSGRAPGRYVVAQGTRLGRAGRVHIERHGDTVWVGGDSVTCVRGEVDV